MPDGPVGVVKEPPPAEVQHAAAEQELPAAGKLHAGHLPGQLACLGDGGGVLPDGVGAVGLPAVLEQHGAVCIYRETRRLPLDLPGINGFTPHLHGGQDGVLVRKPLPGGGYEIEGGKKQRHAGQQEQHALLVAVQVFDSCRHGGLPLSCVDGGLPHYTVACAGLQLWGLWAGDAPGIAPKRPFVFKRLRARRLYLILGAKGGTAHADRDQDRPVLRRTEGHRADRRGERAD